MNARADFATGLAARDVVDAGRAAELADLVATPWWLAVLMAIAAWFASLMLVSTFFAPLFLAGFGTGPVARGIGGTMLLAVALWLFGRGKSFTDQMGLAFSLAGQALLVSAFANVLDPSITNYDALWTMGLLVAVAMMVAPSTPTHRTLCALLACAHLGALIGFGNGLSSYAVALAAGAVAAWLGRSRWGYLPAALPVKPIAHALTLSALVCAWLVGVDAARDALLLLAGEDVDGRVWRWVYPVGASMVLLAAVGWLGREAPAAFRGVVLGGATLFIVAAWHAPGLITSAAILLAVFHACHRSWSLLALLATLLYLGEFYYSLQATLLVKSGALAVTGLVLIGLRFMLGRWQERAI